MKKLWLRCVFLLCIAGLVCGCTQSTSSKNSAESTTLAEVCSSGKGYLVTPADYVKFYNDPAQYEGYVLFNSYQIHSDLIEREGSFWYESVGWVDQEVPNNFTLLEWGQSQTSPDLAVGDIVYVLGTVGADVVGTDENGNKIPLPHVKVTSVEKDASTADLFTTANNRSFTDQIYTQDSLTVELQEISFEEDQTLVILESQDSSLTDFATYYYDIILHQDGYAFWYADCNVILFTGNSTSRDTVPFCAFDSQKPLTVEIHIKDEIGNRLYDPIFFEVD